MINMSLAGPSQKGTAQWFLRGAASHLTRAFVTRFSAARSVAVCGYPRSGTSWVSEVLAGYYDLPCHRHFQWPKFHAQVLHTHDLELGDIRRIFYIVRSPYHSYVSLFVKRHGIIDPLAVGDAATLRRQFKVFLKQETERPYEAPCRWSDHVAQAISRFGPQAIIPYASDPQQMIASLASRLTILEGRVDHDKLGQLVSGGTAVSEPTTRTSTAARLFSWYDDETQALVEDEIERLRSMIPESGRLPLWGAAE